MAWSEDLLVQAKSSLDSLYQSLRGKDHQETSSAYANLALGAYPQSVVTALKDDLNTPRALAAMHELGAALRRAEDEEARNQARSALLAGGWLLGLLGQSPDEHFTAGDAQDSLDAQQIEALIEARRQARADGDYAGADRIRDDLAEAGIELEDSRDGTRWRRR